MPSSSSKRPASDDDKTTTTKYQKLSGREHILARPDMYIGSTNPEVTENTIVDTDGALVTKVFEVVPAFLQCFEEILMNAADRVSAAHEPGSTIASPTKNIKVTVSEEEISVYNDGDGIPATFLEEHQVYAPELIFGHLLSSSNFVDSEKRLNSGKNGIGSKSVNIFSTSFRVETACVKTGVRYLQAFEDNMAVISAPVLTKFSKSQKPYTTISFTPDFGRLNMPGKITADVAGILRRRCYEVSATSYDPIKVWFNGTRVPVTTVDKYTALYVPDAASRFSAVVNERWRVSIGVTPEHGKFRAISFCNSTATLDGGKHVDHVVDPLVKKLVEFYRRKFKVTTSLKPGVVRDCITFVVSAFIENPVYRSQCKNYLSSSADTFGSWCSVPDSLFTKLAKSGPLSVAVESHIKRKENRVLNSTDGKKSSKIKGIAKLHDAARAGTRDSSKCTLFLCEGDSALTMLLSGLSSSDRDLCGCFPLKGKLLNIRDASPAQVAANTEIGNIKKILGLQQGKVYDDAKSLGELRYGSVVLCVDADDDGKHIAGLLLNVFDCFWPRLVDAGYIKNMLTPIVRATGPRGSTPKLFYNEFDFLEWMESAANAKGYKLKYLKGLGSSTAQESKEYFHNFGETLVTFCRDEESSASMQLAFSKHRANDRKAWLSTYDRSEILSANQKKVSLSQFVHLGLKHFSESDVRRSIPSAIDGLKTSQRKILFGCFSRSTLSTTEMKVAQLCGYVADKSRYHHGEVSLSSAITAMAQDFVGANNLNLLLPKGQLGSRLQGGKDAASPRYTFVQLNPITALLFRAEDAPILEYTQDDGVQTEPVHYVPIIPMSLVNRQEGIGSGFSTSVPAHNPLDLIENVKRRLASLDPMEVKPWYRGFQGSIRPADKGSFVSVGVYSLRSGNEVVHITELPIGTWTTSYKVFLDGLVEKKAVASYTERCTDVDVDITVKLISAAQEDVVVTLLKLSSTLRTSNMHLYSARNRIAKFESVHEIEEEHFRARFEAYVLRKEHMVKVLAHELEILKSKARFIESKMSGEIVIDNVSFDQTMARLEEHGFPRLGKTFDAVDKTYAYVTSLNMFDVTSERVAKLRKEVELKSLKFGQIMKTSVPQMWVKELDELGLLYNHTNNLDKLKAPFAPGGGGGA